LLLLAMITGLSIAQEIPRPGHEFRFPGDHGAHAGFSTEWWYVTGHLERRGQSGTSPIGFQWTVFRVSAAASPVSTVSGKWGIHELYLAHFAIVDAGGFA